MKNVLLYCLRLYLKVGLFFYFKKFRVIGKDSIPKDKPLLVLGNHQSALIDPLLLAVSFQHYAYYLTRAGVFQKKAVGKLLNFVNMLPVYRIRDGWGNLSNNNPIFEKCINLLEDSRTIVIFPEGNHSLVRTVRPLSKGFTRIVLDTLEHAPQTDLHLLPVGFNYQNATGFPDSASVYFGKPIKVKEMLTSDVFENIAILKDTIHEELTNLTTHIPSENYEELIAKLEQIDVDFLNPIAVNGCIANNFEGCEKRTDKSFNYFKLVVYPLLFVPICIWRYVVKPKVEEPEFIATFRFTVSVVLVPLWLLLIAFAVLLTLGWQLAVSFILVSIAIMLAYVKA